MQRIIMVVMVVLVGCGAACRKQVVPETSVVKKTPHFTLEGPVVTELAVPDLVKESITIGHEYCGGDLQHTDAIYPGQFVQGENPGKVYYIAADRKRYVAPVLEVAATWLTTQPVQKNYLINRNDALLYFCSQVQVVPNHILGSVTVGGEIPIRPGSYNILVVSTLGRIAGRYVVDKKYVLRPAVDDYGLETWFMLEIYLDDYTVSKPIDKVGSYDPATFYKDERYDLSTELTGKPIVRIKIDPMDAAGSTNGKADLEGLMPD